MQRNMDLIFKMMSDIEGCTGVGGIVLSYEGTSTEEVNYNLELLEEAGLIKADIHHSFDGPVIFIDRLTWDGHEFLDHYKNEKVRKKADELAEKKGGLGSKLRDLPFDIAKGLLIEAGKKVFFG